MKKVLLIALCLCMAAFMACQRSGGSSAPAASASPAAAPEVGDLGSFIMRMEDNFEWSDGYQGKVDNQKMLGGQALAVGDTYSLKLTFTASRDLENELFLGFADTTPEANWWKWLSMEGDGSDDQYIPGSKIKAGEEFSIELKLNILYEPTSNLPAANTLVFETRGEGTPGRPFSGVQQPFNINFTEFVLKKIN